LDDAHTLEACLAIDPVVARRVYRLTMAGQWGAFAAATATSFLGRIDRSS
jgi:hypothetical protein